MNGWVSVYLSDRRLKEGLVSYFDTHKRDLNKLNKLSELIIVPMEVYREIKGYVMCHILQFVEPPVEKVKRSKKKEKKVEKEELISTVIEEVKEGESGSTQSV